MEDTSFDDYLKESLQSPSLNDSGIFKQSVLNRLPRRDTDVSWLKTFVITTFTIISCALTYYIIPEAGNVGKSVIDVLSSILTFHIPPLYAIGIVGSFTLFILLFIQLEING